MKHLLLILCTLTLSIISLSQLATKVPFSKIVEDAPNNFEKFRGELSDAQPNDSTYASLVTMEGTKDNQIELSARLIQYYAFIADSASGKSAKALTQEWRKKIKEIRPDYEEQPLASNIAKRKTNGYRFIKTVDKILYSITVLYSKKRVDAYYWVMLTIAKQWNTDMDSEAY